MLINFKPHTFRLQNNIRRNVNTIQIAEPFQIIYETKRNAPRIILKKKHQLTTPQNNATYASRK